LKILSVRHNKTVFRYFL